MFDRQRTVLRAAGVGFLLSGILLALAVGSAAFVLRRDPYRTSRQWEQELLARAENIGPLVLAGLLLFVIVVLALIFSLALVARARRLHPTSGTLAGLFLAAGLLVLAVFSVWVAVVLPVAALQFHAATAEPGRTALLLEARLNEHVFLLSSWCFLALVAPGLYFLGRALRGERGWTPDVLRLAAALIVLHLPVTLYLARQSLLEGRWLGGLAALDHLLLWAGLAAACFFGARWLRRVGRSLPQ